MLPILSKWYEIELLSRMFTTRKFYLRASEASYPLHHLIRNTYQTKDLMGDFFLNLIILIIDK